MTADLRVAELVDALDTVPMAAGPELLATARQFLDGLHRDVEWDASECPDGGVYHGRAGVCEFFANYLQAWDWYTFHPRSVRAFGHDVLVEGEEVGHHACGLHTVRRHWQVWTFDEDGQVTRWVVFRHFADAADRLAGVPAEEEAA